MSTQNQFVCIHGHFYQPPRENPWLETVEAQTTAAPYHDWNERISAECYSANGAARIVSDQNRIVRIVNNYARMSFNFGPTLLSWLMENASRTYRMILEGEQRSRKNFGGHSSAMAQVYNHMILPLANRRDKMTQIRWGIADYQRHYGLPPEGMWLAETAADSETLELLAENGIKFTVMAPHQCKRIRALDSGDGQWIDTPNGWVDTTHPYWVRFASGASLAIFFYDGPASRAIAFEGLLNSGDLFAARLKAGLHNPDKPSLSHVATDGESYGHHHRHGEMALAYTLRLLEEDKSFRLTNYGEFLERFPPEYECEIVENSSWSCAHGVERWRSDCGCNGGRAGWHQHWRAPLRKALDALRDTVAVLTEQEGKRFFRDVWAARDGYIDVVFDRSERKTDEFFGRHATHALAPGEQIRAMQLMEMQRHAQLMYTSCGWFFDDIAGIETVQIIAYAARVLQLAQELFPAESAGLEPAFLKILAEAKSNDPKAGNGARIYNEQVRTMQLGLEQVVAHYAISSVFSAFLEETDLYSYRVRRLSYESTNSGSGRLALGRVHIASAITGQEQSFSFAVLHFGDQNITAAVKPYATAEASAFEAFSGRAIECVQRALFPEVIRLIDRHYGHVDYSLTSLFRDEQRRIMQMILDTTLKDVETSLTSIYEEHASLLRFLTEAGLPKPPVLAMAASFSVNAGLRRALENDSIDLMQLRSLLKQAKADEVQLETADLSFLVDTRMKQAMARLHSSAESLEGLGQVLVLARLMEDLPFDPSLWHAQNIWYEIMRKAPEIVNKLEDRDKDAWESGFCELGECLRIDCAALVAQPRSDLTA